MSEHEQDANVLRAVFRREMLNREFAEHLPSPSFGAPLCEVFFALKEQLQSEGCILVFEDAESPTVTRLARDVDDLLFQRRDFERGIASALAILAHEAGHWRSQARRDPIYLAARDRWDARQPVTADQRALVLGEEVRAWELGTTELLNIAPGLNQVFWVEYAATRDQALRTYHCQQG